MNNHQARAHRRQAALASRPAGPGLFPRLLAILLAAASLVLWAALFISPAPANFICALFALGLNWYTLRLWTGAA
jgi:hypothetical protein